jgi:nifR3 family TIM-barrel protein
MQIGSLTLANNTILAPLAGITNLPFRLLAKEAGCALVCSEMISSHGLVYKSEKTEKMLDSTPEEKPLSVQLFGAKPDIMAEAAAIVESSGAEVVDINFGCSVRKIIKTGSGAALMRTPELAQDLLKAVRRAIRIPLTIKIRSGWDASGQQAVHISRIAENCGVDAVAVHPRTAGQLFSGRADWSIIAAVKEKVSIPVIGNGDIMSAGDAVRMLGETGCDGVMIGRKAIGNPDIFSSVVARINGEKDVEDSFARRFDLMSRYLRASVIYIGEEQAFREAIKHLSSEAEGIELIQAYRDELQKCDKLTT